MRTIKRYPNRKLYDVTSCRYVTLQTIRDMVRGGDTVQVVHSQTGKDMTKEVLSRIVLEDEMVTGGGLSVNILTDIIKKSSKTVMGYIKKSWDAGLGAAGKYGTDINRSVRDVVKVGKKKLNDAEHFRRDLLEKIKVKVSEREKYLEEHVQKGISRGLRTLDVATRSDLEELRARLRKLETRIGALSSPRRPARARRTA